MVGDQDSSLVEVGSLAKNVPKPPYLLQIHILSLYQICTNYNTTPYASDFDVSEIKIMHSEKWLPYHGK